MTPSSAVMVDLVSYSGIAAVLEQSIGAAATGALNAQIQKFICDALARAGGNRGNLVLTTGDGALLRFETCDQAIRFSHALQTLCGETNREKSEPTAKRVFRVGIGTGDLFFDPEAANGPVLAGMAIVRAARLEAKAPPGGVLVDEATWCGLSAAQRTGFTGPEEIAGKRGETFQAYRAQFDHDALLMVRAEERGSGARRSIVDVKRADLLWEIRQMGNGLRREQLDFLLILLDIPSHRMPSEKLAIEQQVIEVIRWASEDSTGLHELHDQLARLAARGPGAD